MSLYLTGGGAATLSPYVEAVNDARFVRTFGLISLVGSLFIFFGGSAVIGVGLAVMGFGKESYYLRLGLPSSSWR